MKKIVSWVENKGVEGYLSFEDKELRISQNDPREVKSERKDEKESDKKRERSLSLETGEKKYERKGKQGAKNPLSTNCKELYKILKLYSKMVNIPIKTLLERLDQVSGDFTQLDNFV